MSAGGDGSGGRKGSSLESSRSMTGERGGGEKPALGAEWVNRVVYA